MMKKLLMKNFIVAVTSFLLIAVKSFGADFWLPAQIVIQPDGSLTHNFPFPLGNKRQGESGASFPTLRLAL